MSVRITSFRFHGLTFFENRRLFAFTSISQATCENMVKSGIFTMELRSASNVYALLSTQDNAVFITEKSKEDMRRGARGIVAEIRSVSIMEHKTRGRDESEVVVARVQVEIRGMAKAKQIIDHGMGKPIEVFVEEVVGCAAS